MPRDVESAQSGRGEPLFCDVAEEIRAAVNAYDAGGHMAQGRLSVGIESLRGWADAMERASLIIEGPAD